MAWLARSFSSPFQEESDDEKYEEKTGAEKDQGRGMKEDLSELTRSFTKQLWGVASFLAPPPATTGASAAKPSDSSAAPGSNPEPIAFHARPVHPQQCNLWHSDLPLLSCNYIQKCSILCNPKSIGRHEQCDRKLTGGKGRRNLTLYSMGIFKESLQLEAVDQTHEDRENSFHGDSSENAQRLMGIRSDFAEISGSVRTGLSRFSSNKAVHGISKLASNFLPFKRESEGEEEEKEEEKSGAFDQKSLRSAVGITEEVLTFARNISMHPETWLDFPLFNDEDDHDDFDMSDIQREHALGIERLAPRLAALRIELCPGYMSEGCFWKIYFVLLHSRLNKQDALLLSTPQIVEARGLLLQELQNRTKAQAGQTGSDMAYSEEKSTFLSQEDTFLKQSNISEKNERTESFKIVSLQAATSVAAKDFQTDEQTTQRGISSDQVHSEEPLIQNKNVLSGTVKLSEYNYEDEEEEVDDWLEEEPAGMDVPVRTRAGLENEDDVSFSDLEDEDDINVQATSSNVKESFHSSSKGTKGWVQLEKSTDFIGVGSSSHYSSAEGPSTSHSRSSADVLILHGREASAERQTIKPDSGESNDWLTVEEDDIVSADSS
ncbi:hypothetical protein KI387_028977 [Taxus chinensis]|uniref:BSD domain-containing protein n=1 Tax=Taxus chinensis TaxID=29808 RepID=A0AA38FCS5_TAXCH|nr:hypothetical protein KI387_028977 [Taxus chinensis]